MADCSHENRVQQILSDRSAVYDCGDCGEALVEIGGAFVTVIEAAA